MKMILLLGEFFKRNVNDFNDVWYDRHFNSGSSSTCW